MKISQPPPKHCFAVHFVGIEGQRFHVDVEHEDPNAADDVLVALATRDLDESATATFIEPYEQEEE